MDRDNFPWRLGAVVRLPLGERAAVVELRATSMVLRNLTSEEVIEYARSFVMSLPVCGYLARDLLVTLLPIDCEQLPCGVDEPVFTLGGDARVALRSAGWF